MKQLLRRGLLALVMFVAVGLTAKAGTVVNLAFDATLDGTLSGPFVGTGTFTTDSNLVVDGTYSVFGLLNPNITLQFGATTLTPADVSAFHPALSITIAGGGTEFYFDSPVAPAATAGGTIEFTQFAPTFFSLIIQPNTSGVPPYNQYGGISGVLGILSGNYGATSIVVGAAVPEPGTVTLALISVASIACLRITRRK